MSHSQEPGQGRLGSPRPPSIRGSNFGLDFGQQNSQGASQRSALFPWDHAGDIGASSSVDDAAFNFGNEEFGLDQVEVRLKGSSTSARSRRASSQLMSRVGSLGEPGSPLKPADNFQLEDDNFAFEGESLDVSSTLPPAQDNQFLQIIQRLLSPSIQISNLSILNVIPSISLSMCSLKNNVAFLTKIIRYAKMQYRSLPGPNASLTFEDVVPKASSNAHIASSALYHCLGQFGLSDG